MVGVAVPKDTSREMLAHMLRVVDETPAEHKPFSHIYLEGLFPADVYAEMMAQLPEGSCYRAIHPYKHSRDDGVSTRDVLPLVDDDLAALPERQRTIWDSVSRALSAPELKSAIFRKLAPDLALRFAMSESDVERLVAYCRPCLLRDLEGYEIPPHPDGRAKIVTMQLYLPKDRTQLALGTALYKRRLTSLRGLVSWHGRFAKVKQFPFAPNSGYAFAVSNSLWRKSWHGREKLPSGAGVRNSILNLYFADEKRDY
jgi:hypothetical protein